MHCKIENNACIDSQKGRYAKCRQCPRYNVKVCVDAMISYRNRQFLVDLCKVDGYQLDEAISQLIDQGIRSLERKVDLFSNRA